MTLPEKYFRLVVESRGKAYYYQKLGGTYAKESAARQQLTRLRNKGMRCDLYETDTNWRLIDKQPELEGQEGLF